MTHKIDYIEAYNVASFNKAITLFYRKQPRFKDLDPVERLVSASAFYLGQPYLLGASGEGREGIFDQAPLYRFDYFDCVTYVNTVLSLVLSHDVHSFYKNLLRIGYRDGALDYGKRHHFMSVDWNPSNQSLGFVNDVTKSIVNDSGEMLAETAEALIDRPSWFRHRTFDDIRLLQKISDEEEERLLQAMHNIANVVEAERSNLPYVPIHAMFDKNGNPNIAVFDQIPHGAVVEVVRPNWNLKEKIGTNLNVSHVGFAIKKSGQLFYRQASSIEKCVCDIPLVDYLRDRIESPTIKGINVQAVIIN